MYIACFATVILKMNFRTFLKSKQILFQCSRTFCSEATRTATFQIYRYDPHKSDPPRMQEYKVPIGKYGHMYLDALFTIKNKLDPTLSFRRSCREGICGSCAMNIEGQNCLACITRISTKGVIKIYPLPSTYVIKDLVVDFSRFYQHYIKTKPYLISKNSIKTPHMQSIRDQFKLIGLYECILCGCCTHSCPAYWWHGSSFMGAAALLHAYRWVIDSRDEAQEERLKDLKDFMNLFRCHSIYNCTSCCPKGLNPGLAIAKLKRLVSKLEKKQVPDRV